MLRPSLPVQVRLRCFVISTELLFFTWSARRCTNEAAAHVVTDEPAAWAYLCDLLSALQHLHSHGFIHLDLKPANVLMTASGRLKLGDFGLLLELKHKGRVTSEDDAQEGDSRYMAPELLCGEYGPAADVFRYKYYASIK